MSARSIPSFRTSADGFKAAAQAGGRQVLDTVDGQNIQDISADHCRNPTANPDMNALYAIGEPALSARFRPRQQATGRSRFGWDLTAQAIKGIDEGWIVAVVQQIRSGGRGVETMLKIKKGDSRRDDIPITIVTRTTSTSSQPLQIGRLEPPRSGRFGRPALQSLAARKPADVEP